MHVPQWLPGCSGAKQRNPRQDWRDVVARYSAAATCPPATPPGSAWYIPMLPYFAPLLAPKPLRSNADNGRGHLAPLRLEMDKVAQRGRWRFADELGVFHLRSYQYKSCRYRESTAGQVPDRLPHCRSC